MKDKMVGKVAIDILKTLYHTDLKTKRHVAEAISKQYHNGTDAKMKIIISKLTGEIVKEK